MDASSDTNSTGTPVEASSASTAASIPASSSSPTCVDPNLPTSFDSPVSASIPKQPRPPSSTSSTFDSVATNDLPIIIQPTILPFTSPVLPPPLRRPPPPTKGILKPPKQVPKGVFASLISRQPRDLVGSLGARLMGETSYSQGVVDTRAGGQSQYQQLQQHHQSNGDGITSQAATTTAGAFFSKALGKLNMAATMTLNNIQSTSNQQPVSSESAQTIASHLSASTEATASMSTQATDLSTVPVEPSESTQQDRSVFLKRASFHLPSISVVYPISSTLPPYSESVAQSREEVEAKYLAKLQEEEGWQYWSSLKLLDLYERACRARDEGVDERIWRALKEVGGVMPPAPRVLNLTGVHLPRFTADALSDVLAVECGLSKLVLDDCDLFDDSLKSILHALLHSQSLPTLSIRSNRRLKPTSWKIIAVYLNQAQNLPLRDLDISENTLDKKSVDALTEGLICPKENQKKPDQTESSEAKVQKENSATNEEPSSISVTNGEESGELEGKIKTEAELQETKQISLLKQRELDRTKSFRNDGLKVGQKQGLETLRVDGCVLRANALESLAQAVRSSNIRNISLRRNKINNLGGVAVALMIKDYPDTHITTSSSNPFSSSSYVNSSAPGSTSSSSSAMTDKSSDSSGKQASTTTSYTPYTPRSRRRLEDLTNGPGSALPAIPLVVSNSRGGITSRTMPDDYSIGRDDRSTDRTEEGNGKVMSAGNKALGGMMQSRVRSFDDVQRIGNLVTLDLKGNDLRGGVTYIAQVLKRNRTLKVINLAENRIDVLGLAALAEALKYNSTLDTLDLNHNPCSGPGLEGINSLRTSFTLNTNLKRLFLANTGLTTEGAIALAEFFPEARHLLHLDLTMNQGIEVAGIMALAVGLRSNRLMRCLDLSIPFNDEDVATLSQDILQSCIRNTELAQEKTTSKASRAAVWGPIQKSTLARIVKEADTARAVADGQSAVSTPAGKARSAVYEYSPTMVITRSEELVVSLDESVEVHNSLGVVLDEIVELIEQAKALRERLEEMIQQSAAVQETQASSEEDRLQVLLGLVDRLTTQLLRAERAKAASDEKKARLEMIKNSMSEPSKLDSSKVASLKVPHTPPHQRSLSSSKRSDEMAVSPNFSIAGDSDDENESESSDYQFPTQTIRTLSSDEQVMLEQGKGELGETEEDSKSFVEFLTDKKRTHWIEEEGEVFRKGVLLGAAEIDEDESEHLSGEQLRKELLETPVDRPTRRMSSEGSDTSIADTETFTTTTAI